MNAPTENPILSPTQPSSKFESDCMVSDNLLWNIETGNDLVEKEKGCCLTFIRKSRHSFGPLHKLIHYYDNVLVTFC